MTGSGVVEGVHDGRVFGMQRPHVLTLSNGTALTLSTYQRDAPQRDAPQRGTNPSIIEGAHDGRILGMPAKAVLEVVRQPEEDGVVD